MSYIKSNRNFDKVQFESLRRVVDPAFNNVHDELSDCYYDKKPFREYGVLTKDVFDKLHGLIFYLRDLELNNANNKLSPDARDLKLEVWLNEDVVVNHETGEKMKRVDMSRDFVEKLSKEGLVLAI